MRLAEGHRGEDGVWHPADPDRYQPMDVHGILPWSVLDQASKTWQDRKKWWLALGVDTPAPREHAQSMIATGRHGRISGGVSRFDPVLAELCCRWYCPPGGKILDPCAGGAVRGLVAGHLGYQYLGLDLSEAQVTANDRLGFDWLRAGRFPGPVPIWGVWDSATGKPMPGTMAADYVLSCPPYHNRERYSDDPGDLSAMPWPRFVEAHARMVARTVEALRDDAFATWVISDVRDSRGHYRRLPALAADHFGQAGCRLVNEQILVAPAGTLAKVMRPAWETARTTTRRHQFVLTFVKGDRRKAARTAQGAGEAT